MTKEGVIRQLSELEKALTQSNERLADLRTRLDALARHSETTRLHIHYLLRELGEGR